jgi:hypothetical protein
MLGNVADAQEERTMAVNFAHVRTLLRSNLKSFGLRHTLYDLAYKAINHVCLFRVLICMAIGEVDPNYLGAESSYTHMFLDTEMLSDFVQNEEHEISPEFLQQALVTGDECYGILDGKELTSYGWYANVPVGVSFFAATPIGKEELRLHFSDEYVYMYKGYTHKNYRGQRLHAIGMTRALAAYLKRGFKGLVSYVEANNYSSLKSVYRMGYRDFGKIYVLRIFGRYLIHSSKGCKQYGFWIEKI